MKWRHDFQPQVSKCRVMLFHLTLYLNFLIVFPYSCYFIRLYCIVSSSSAWYNISFGPLISSARLVLLILYRLRWDRITLSTKPLCFSIIHFSVSISFFFLSPPPSLFCSYTRLVFRLLFIISISFFYCVCPSSFATHMSTNRYG